MEPMIVVLKRMIEKEKNFAYSSHGDATLSQVLQEGRFLKKNRTDAERSAGEDYRVRVPSDQESQDRLLEQGKIKVWDLKNELEKIE